MPALLFELEAWGKMDKNEMNEMKEVNRKALQRILNLPISTSYISLTLIRLGFLRVVYSGWWGLIWSHKPPPPPPPPLYILRRSHLIPIQLYKVFKLSIWSMLKVKNNADIIYYKLF